ncbi:MAG: ABC transporter ATP-binding protein, partial [Blastocatellia bacterium]|nr:ABC transporter ATP-binding protein [Blastocatellia bacterium]
GVVPEEPNAPPDMTTEELVNFCSKLYKNWDNKNVQSRLQKFSIATKTRFGQLSKGQKCQVMLALALGHSPDLLVLDDPTLGLDVVARREFFEEVIGELADNGITILITTHDLPGIENIASHVGILKNGSLMVNEEMEVLKSKFRRIRYTGRGGQVAHNYTGELEPMSALDITVGHWGIEAVVSDFDDKRFDRLRMLEGLTEPEVVAMSLEEIFATVVSERTPSKK